VVFSVDLADTDLACNLLCETAEISARDAIHAAVMRNHEVESLLSGYKSNRINWLESRGRSVWEMPS
jgi:hypothetical protein